MYFQIKKYQNKSIIIFQKKFILYTKIVSNDKSHLIVNHYDEKNSKNKINILNKNKNIKNKKIALDELSKNTTNNKFLIVKKIKNLKNFCKYRKINKKLLKKLR